MRPEAHKQIASRRYQARHRDVAATTTTTTPRRTGKSRGGEDRFNVNSENNARTDATSQYGRSRYSRRNLESNASRYRESDSDEEPAEVSDTGTDRETKDLLSLLKNAEKEDFDPTTYFQLKGDQDWKNEDGEGTSSSIYRELLDIQSDELDAALDILPLHERLGTDKQTANELESEVISGSMPLPPLVPMTVMQDALLLRPKPKKEEQAEEDDESLFLEEDKQVHAKKPSTAFPTKELTRMKASTKSVSFVKEPPSGALGVNSKSDSPIVTATPHPKFDPTVPMDESLIQTKKNGLEGELDYLLLLDGKSSDETSAGSARQSKSLPKLSASKPHQRKTLSPAADNDDLLHDLLNS